MPVVESNVAFVEHVEHKCNFKFGKTLVADEATQMHSSGISLTSHHN